MPAKQERLYADVSFLTSIQPARSYDQPASLARVVEYLKTEFQQAGAQPVEQKWIVDQVTYSNVIASYNPEQQKRLIVGAHYDVCGDQPGADDNASAVAGLLESARLVFEQQPQLDYRIDFVAYCLEEPPFFGSSQMGSYVHAQSLYEQKVEVMGMICFEMIGYFSEEPNSQPFPDPALAAIYPSVANFIMVVGIDRFKDFNNRIHALMSQDAQIDVQLIHFPDTEPLASMSDQRNYWYFDYPALMINDTAFVRNPNYHLPSDTIDTLDFDKMTAVVSAAYRGIVEL